MPYPHWTRSREIWANVDRRFRHRARLRFQPRRRTRRSRTSVRRWTTKEETRDRPASWARRGTRARRCAGESAAAAFPLRVAASLITLLRRIVELWPVVCVHTTTRIHMSSQVARSIRRQLLRRALSVQRVRQQSQRQAVEITGQPCRELLRTHAGSQMQQRRIHPKQEDARCAGVVLRRRRSHESSKEYEKAQLRFIGQARASSAILSGRCFVDEILFCSNYWRGRGWV